MINVAILDFVFYIVIILILFSLIYLNKLYKKLNEEENEEQINKKAEENITYYYVHVINWKFNTYKDSNRLSFYFYGEIDIIEVSPQKSNKIIIFFDDIIQTEYKYFLYNYINAASEEQIRTIYKN